MGESPSTGSDPVYSWMLEGQARRFAISGTFETDLVQSSFNPGVFRLNVAPVSVSTSAPTYAQFSFPSQLIFGDGNALYMNEQAAFCNDDEFYGKHRPGYMCSVTVLGWSRWDEAALFADSISLFGRASSSSFLGPLFGWAFGLPTPPDDIDYSRITGLFSYSIHAHAVPEPGTLALLLGGLGISWRSRRRLQPAALQ